MKEYPLNYREGSVPAPVAEIPFFKTLAPEIVEKMLASTTMLDCDPGDVVIEEGDAGRDLFFLLKGRVRVQKDGSVIGAASGGGVVLGEIALLKEGQRTATIVAETQVYCIKVEQAFLDTLDAEARNAYYAAMYRFLAELLAQRLDSASEKLVSAEKMIAELRKG
ncbi:MAG: cyclic nucleotide-binding domain-containing protein [Verrucomicrobiales bacterium]|nr:cyclic nucleotide-binding domain-containing protein [Verrucomicrobiales bacterium]